MYLFICTASTVAIAVNIFNTFDNISDCIRTSFFTVTTIISTTGFGTADFDLWPSFSKAIIIVLMITGGCAGSTAGGMKLSRILILLKSIFRELRHMLRPRSVNVIKIDGEAIPDETLRSALGYLSIYFTVFISTFVLLSTNGFSFATNITATLTTLNNVGPGFELISPSGNFATFPYFSKIILCFSMLIGRLEIIPMFILFSPLAWKKR